ncbi:protein kinase family protein [Stieleria varia]|uniref:Serine/threonine-protein kinase PknK n=1 Tax=Stieleria varia TaxID=2528005 RepID=A0A5C6B1N8_9BACT|nr:protein kinase family protein [Stieleria varia]TWU05810.1 Serine/threonine-protein kinase PknK [Stieleria varia]
MSRFTHNGMPDQLGIWRVGRTLQKSDRFVVSLCQPVDAGHDRRWDYAIKYPASHTTEAVIEINQAIAASSVVSHPNLVPVLDGCVTDRQAFLVMPFLPGRSMQWHLDHGPAKPLPVALWLVRQTAQALAVMHEAGWSHGDVKPENIVVADNGHATLIDLGFAADCSQPNGSVFRGTPEYAAPELLSNAAPQSFASDVFALGRVLWQWLIASDVDDESILGPIVEMVEWMVAESPSKRPDASDVARKLLRMEIDTLGHHIGPQRRAA